MPPKVRLRSLEQLAEVYSQKHVSICRRCQYATVAAVVPAPSHAQMSAPLPATSRYPPTQPPSYRDPTYRKSQLLRSYVSLLQSTPVMLLFQHNNLKANEWLGIRRELASALRRVDDQLLSSEREAQALGDAIRLQVVRTTIFEPALRIAEYYHPEEQQAGREPSDTIPSETKDPSLTHVLSESAYFAAKAKENLHPLTPLLSGPIALLTLPTVSPPHLRAALSVLSPKSPSFPPPSRRLNPGFWDPPVQDGLKKLLLLGARIEGRVFDMEGARWVGGIEGGLDGLRAQLVGLLQGFGAGLTTTLESASRSLWLTVHGRRSMLEAEQQESVESKGAGELNS